MNDSLHDPVRALCVSIHDVAPATWDACETLLKAIHDVAPLPVTLLVVPQYHRLPVRNEWPFRRAIDRRLALGDEAALHGWSHLDEGAPPRTLAERLRRRVYTTGEGEFAALSAAEAQRRLAAGQAWFARRGWEAEGFVAPAWLLGEEAWHAVRGAGFAWTTTIDAFHRLAHGDVLPAPSLVYGARHAGSRAFSRLRNGWLEQSQRAAPLVRLGLHPADARHPSLIDDCRRLLGRLLATRTPMTKSGFARAWQGRGARVPADGVLPAAS